MSEDVIFQTRLFLMAIFWGAMLILAYDLLRLVRLFVWKKGVQIFLEIVFWIAASFAVYTLIARYNHGAVRNYVVFGMGMGMMVYRLVFSSIFMSMAYFVLRPFVKMAKILKTLVNYSKKALKSVVFKVKMKFNNKKGRKG